MSVVKTLLLELLPGRRLTAPHLEQVLEPESMAAEHLGQEAWLKLTGCIFDVWWAFPTFVAERAGLYI